MTRAERQRRWRQRQRAGVFIARVAIPPPVVEALIRSERLDERQVSDKHKIEAALNEVLTRWARAWAP